MILDDILDGADAYIDANIFLYIALDRKSYMDSCNKFLDNKIPLRDVPQLIRQNPKVISELTKCWEAIDAILSMNITVLKQPTDFDLVVDACRNYNLLTKDALHVSIMKAHNITNIASNDSDFERVDWINLYKPKKE